MSALPAADGTAMTVKVTLRPDVNPELYWALMALPERLRAQRLRVLAAQGLATDEASSDRKPARKAPQRENGRRLSGGSTPAGSKAQTRQPVGALPVASGPLQSNAPKNSERLSAAQPAKEQFPQAGQALAALPVAGGVPAGKAPLADVAPAVQPHAETPRGLVEAAPNGVSTGGGEASEPGAAGSRSTEEANRTGAFNLAVMMARRGVFTA
jgi:hypothetical protein